MPLPTARAILELINIYKTMNLGLNAPQIQKKLTLTFIIPKG